MLQQESLFQNHIQDNSKNLGDSIDQSLCVSSAPGVYTVVSDKIRKTEEQLFANGQGMLSGLSCGWPQEANCLRLYDNTSEGSRVAEILAQGQAIGISPRSVASYPDSINLVSTQSSSSDQYKESDLIENTRDQLSMMYMSTAAQNSAVGKGVNLQAPSKLSLISLPHDLSSDEELTPGIMNPSKLHNAHIQDENILVQSDLVRMINNRNTNNHHSQSQRHTVDTLTSQSALQDIQFLKLDTSQNAPLNTTYYNTNINNNNNNNQSNRGSSKQQHARHSTQKLEFHGDYSSNSAHTHFNSVPPPIMTDNLRNNLGGGGDGSLMPSVSPLCSPTNSYQQGACGWGGQSSLYPLMGLTYPHCAQLMYSPGINHQMGLTLDSQSSLQNSPSIPPTLQQNGMCNMQGGMNMGGGQMYPFAFNHMEYQKVMQQLTCANNTTKPHNTHFDAHRNKDVWRSRRDHHKYYNQRQQSGGVMSRREHERRCQQQAGGGYEAGGVRPTSRQGSYFTEDAGGWMDGLYYDINSMLGHLVELAMDQEGSRLIQVKLQEADEEQFQRAFQELLPSLLTLMMHVFGNYVVQKLLDFSSPAHKKLIAEKLQNHILFLSLHMYGCRVVQKIIETLDSNTVIRLIRQLEGNVMKCVKDQNGNHVIQKCLECLQTQDIMFMYKTFVTPVDNLVEMCSDAYGGRVVQRLLENCTDESIQNITKQEILKRTVELSKDQYGNYIVQHLVEHGAPADRETIVRMLCPDIVKHSLQKFASNVVEKCLTHGSIKDKKQMIEKLLGNGKDCQPLLLLARDAYGNYVVQKMLEGCDDANRHLMVAYIEQHQDCLRKYSYGKHIVGKVMRYSNSPCCYSPNYTL